MNSADLEETDWPNGSVLRRSIYLPVAGGSAVFVNQGLKSGALSSWREAFRLTGAAAEAEEDEL
jgi:hypothetical protein